SIDDDPAAAMRYCLAPETRVETPNGTYRIGELVEGAEPDSDTPIDREVLDRRGRPVHASMFFHSGEHPTLRLRTREGYELTGTLNHPVLCLVDMVGVPLLLWKRLDEIAPGDRVLMARMDRDDGDWTTHRDRKEALLLGAFVAEGWASETRAGFNNVDSAFFASVLDAYDTVVGGPRYAYSRAIRSGSTLHELDVQNLASVRASALATLIGVASDEKVVPERVWRAARDYKRVFLQALFMGDGSCSLLPRATIQISYSTYSEQLAKDVQLLLLEFGVVSRLCRYEKGERKVVITNRRDAREFCARVGFLGAKQQKLERLLAQIPTASRALSRDHVPYLGEYIRSESGDRWLRRHNVDRIERWEQGGTAIMERIVSDEVRATVAPLVTGDYYYAEVASVEDAGVQPVYSLRVDTDDHSFLTNG
ncbi:MAG: LAGLIDADG family homing endonuclease, partial [Gaiellaceae bacterium]